MPNNTTIIAYNEMVHNGDSMYNNIVLSSINGNEFFSKKITTNAQASYPVVQPINNDKVVVAWKQDAKVFYTIAQVQSINTPVQTTMQQTVFVKPNLSSLHLAVAKDLSCGMPLKAVEDTAQYKGKVYGFCSKECKDDFMKNPKQYIVVK